MEGLLPHAVKVFMGFFAIMNPIANVPIFLGLTEGDDRPTVRAVALQSVALAFAITAVFAVAGNVILGLFGITLPAFRIAGGLLVSMIGFHMLQGRQSSVHQLKNEETEGLRRDAALGVAVSPLAMPILAGPGTITTAMSFSSEGGVPAVAVTLVAFALLCVITYLLFLFGERFVGLVGAGVLGVITRMMGLILAVIGVQMVIEGLQGAFCLAG